MVVYIKMSYLRYPTYIIVLRLWLAYRHNISFCPFCLPYFSQHLLRYQLAALGSLLLTVKKRYHQSMEVHRFSIHYNFRPSGRWNGYHCCLLFRASKCTPTPHSHSYQTRISKYLVHPVVNDSVTGRRGKPAQPNWCELCTVHQNRQMHYLSHVRGQFL